MAEALAPFHRTTVDVDLVPFEHARDALGTRGYKDTINAALAEVARDRGIAQFADHESPFKAELRLRRTIVDIEVDAYARAREALGTRGYKDTVGAALRAVARRKGLRDFAERIRRNEFRAPTPEELAEMRKPRVLG